MSKPIKLDETLVLRDASGAALRIFVPEDALNELLAESDRLRQQVAEQQKQIDALQEDCNGYLQTIFALLPRSEVSFTREELVDLERNGVSMRQVVEEVEKIVNAGRSEGSND
jgi:hypothetical protein